MSRGVSVFARVRSLSAIAAAVLLCSGCRLQLGDTELWGGGESAAKPRDEKPRTAEVGGDSRELARGFTDDVDVRARLAAIDNLNSQIASLNTRLDSLHRQIETASGDKQRLEKEAGEQQVEMQRLRQEGEELHQSVERQRSDNERLLTNNKILMDNLERERQNLATLDQEAKEKRQELAEAEASVKAIPQQIASHQQQVESLRSEIAAKTVKRDELSTKVAELERLAANFDETKARLESNIKRLEMSISSLEHGLDTAADAAPATPPTPPAPAAEPPAAAPVQAPPAAPAIPAADLGQRQTTILPVVADSYLIEAEPNADKGTAQGLVVGFSKDFKNLRMIANFDLSGIPEGAMVSAARVKFFCYNVHQVAANERIGVYPVISAWDERGVNWDSASFVPVPLDTVDVLAPNQWYSWDITSLLGGWLAGESGNYGVLFKYATETSEGESRFFYFRSKEGADNQPHIEVEYLIP